MCGIAGFVSARSLTAEVANRVVRLMQGCLGHRGPDDSGEWVDAEAGVALGHRRLSVLELSPAGHQPMASPSGRFVMVFNGECYNHEALRAELGPSDWRGGSDTETVLAMIERWGVEPTLRRMIGMFALAVWDRSSRSLILARDRMGEKPLFYGWQGDSFLFGSELKALRAHPDFVPDVDRDVLAAYLRHGYVPGPHCIHRGLHKLAPGSLLAVRADQPRPERYEPQPYWDLRAVVEAGASEPFTGTFVEAANELERRLSAAVALQRVADVPLGAFLSGGIDSSLVTALMQAQSSGPVRTFTIGFHETGFNEAEHAAEIARHLGTAHTEMYVTPGEVRDVIPRLPTLYDEPFGDASALPTHIVACLARRHVTVALSGDGGDELFFGYSRYLRIAQLHRRIERMPIGLRGIIASTLGAVHHSADALRFLPGSRRWLPAARRKSARAAAVLRAPSIAALYRSLVSHWDDAELLVGATELATHFDEVDGLAALVGPERTLMYLDYRTILPEDILAKVDRAAMGVSLETRVPFLDHRVVEFAQTLPIDYVYGGMQGKRVVREVLSRYIPRPLFERPKQGFAVPIADWMRGPLRAWAEDLLDARRIREEGFFDPHLLQRRWREYLVDGASWEYQIWDVLMFQAWYASLRQHPLAAAA